jgi:mevalonate kinase
MPVRHHHAQGKLLLTGEYLVIHGALSLALPVRWGQAMSLRYSRGRPVISWDARQKGSTWFSAEISYEPWEIIFSSDTQSGSYLERLLKAAASIRPGVFSGSTAYSFVTNLEFDRNWGLGSSSSLIVNLAWCLRLDPFDLFKAVSRGSGYDIAASMSRQPLIYRLHEGTPQYRKIGFDPPFKEMLYFVYLGRKQDTQASIDRFLDLKKPGDEIVDRLSAITRAVIKTESLIEFENLLREHEDLVSGFTGMKKISQEQFPGFHGTIKSLGAWGGDFILACSSSDPEAVPGWFRDRGYESVIRYDEMMP